MSKTERIEKAQYLFGLMVHLVESMREMVTEYDRIYAKLFDETLRPRCVTTRELHLNMAEQSGLSLEELQTKYDLNKITIKGRGVEIVKPK